MEHTCSFIGNGNRFIGPQNDYFVWPLAQPAAPTECRGDVHVFASEKKCRCGKATMTEAQ